MPTPFAKKALRALAVIGLLLAASHASATTYEYRVRSAGLRGSSIVLAFQNSGGAALSSLSFPDTAVGSNSASLQVLLKNTSSAPLVFGATPVSVPAPFAISSTTCAGTLMPAGNCTVNLTFTPPAAQAYNGATYSLTANYSNVVSSLLLSGSGTSSPGVRAVTGVGGDSTFLQKADGTWSVAGSNASGQLGLGTTANALSFVPVPALNGATQVVVGDAFTFARLSSGNWVATGDNTYGQLGIGSTNNKTSFGAVPALNGALKVVVGSANTFAQLSTGAWVGVGRGFPGTLGLGNNVSSLYTNFVSIPAIGKATDVVISGYSTFARLSSGNWVATGSNGFARLGLGPYADTVIYSFTSVTAIDGATQVVAGENATFARLANGVWVGVGYNNLGSLGTGDFGGLSYFTTIPALNGATQVVAGASHTFAQFINGNWSATGFAAQGQLGVGTTTNSATFIGVPLLNGASQVAAGRYYTITKLNTGTWAATGINSSGQLGLGDTTNRKSFTTITP